MNDTLDKTIGQMVAEDYRTAQIFKNHKIDFCCKGNRTLQEVAEKKGLDLDSLVQELDTVQNQNQSDQPDFKTWPLDLLADYIEKKHHRYVEQQIPILKQYLTKLCKVHGERHPELHEIFEHFNASAGELAMHMKKEELVLFPWIRKMVSGPTNEQPHFGTVKNPIKMMMEEHDNEGERFRKIAELSHDYTPPADACNTYRVAFSLLQEFEEDLHRHIHLENNILFPKAEILENNVLSN
ncbi:iron-sulfur cluster repair di-iron protein [Flagellimonas halotolerans]|uniref:Iron-sulfur cluster repair di-iron protein n=1 Tax=Flagellimonas halotolerans TaxID=3112164 RepID=A0ABU6IT67_9FLAO|nr:MULTISPECIES: iron-sulfur cluster repair di-iron protein [unclassified Allomuricauda]MEC3966389.1 iron-sulfur cluster repair di-iron protein [Muricauda sp. SYSU M86414]MEC4266254.1 iron-sulfur cluster repair di-iron protein [Muricauda sp. SYSU M84420]